MNVSLLGDRLKIKLEEKGIGAINNKKDIVDMLLKRGLSYPSSYNVSREVVQETLAQNRISSTSLIFIEILLENR